MEVKVILVLSVLNKISIIIYAKMDKPLLEQTPIFPSNKHPIHHQLLMSES